MCLFLFLTVLCIQVILNFQSRKEIWSLIEDRNWDKIYYSEGISFNGIDPKDNILKMTMVRLLDPMPICEIKIFNAGKNINIGVTYSSYDGATTSSEKTIFYKYDNGKFEDITREIFKSFNYYTDNYTNNAIDSLNLYYKTNLRKTPRNDYLIYKFTKSDTVIIAESFFGTEVGIELDTTYFDGEFYTKKYIMDNGKLRLAE